MELFLDDSKLFPIQTLPSPPPTAEISAISQWWSSLTEEEQAKICRIDTTEILIDLIDITNTAFVLFKIAECDEMPAPITCRETAEDPEETFTSHIFDFEFNQFEPLQSDLQQIFSSYTLHTFFPHPAMPESIDSLPSSYIECREGSVVQLLSLLTNLGREVNEIRQKSLLGRENAFEQYSLFLKHTLAGFSFSLVESESIKEFCAKILAVSLLLEKNLMASYYEKIVSFSLFNTSQLSEIMDDPISPILKSRSRLFKGENRLDSTKETFSSTASQSGSSLFEEESLTFPIFKKTSKPFIPKSMQAEIGLNLKRKPSPYIYQEPAHPLHEYQEFYSQENLKSQDAFNLCQGYEGFEIGNMEVSFGPEDRFLCGKDVDRFPKALKNTVEYKAHQMMLSEKFGKKPASTKSGYYQRKELQSGDNTGKAGTYKKFSNFKTMKENQTRENNKTNQGSQILLEGLTNSTRKTKREDIKRKPAEEKGHSFSHSTRNHGKNNSNRNPVMAGCQKKEMCAT